jgi:hypothetical protein
VWTCGPVGKEKMNITLIGLTLIAAILVGIVLLTRFLTSREPE